MNVLAVVQAGKSSEKTAGFMPNFISYGISRNTAQPEQYKVDETM